MKRPELLEFASVCELYKHFERIFLNGNAACNVVSACGHNLRIYDHHFFHFVKLDDPKKPRPLLMANEKPIILAITDGFGPYGYDRQRAIYLESAMLCLKRPDEVWEDVNLNSSRWVYLKHFDATPYSSTVLLVGERDEGCVPVTSFPAKRRDARKWRRGVKIYP